MRWFIYNVAFAVAYALMSPHFLFRMWRRGGYRQNFMQRFGRYDPETRQRLAEGGRIWIHAVSVGEMHVALRMISDLLEQDPAARFVVSTTTSTAHAIATRELGAESVLIYFPVDFPVVMRRILDLVRPCALVMTEIEIWPNLVRLARGRGVPMMIINGRISNRSYRGYGRLRGFFSETVNRIDRICVQSERDAERFQALGCEPGRIQVLGSMKYDTAAAPDDDGSAARRILDSIGVSRDAVVLVAGSTWEGEEVALVEICERLRQAHPELYLVLVPRHFERGDAVAAAVEAAGVRCLRRSQIDTHIPCDGPSVLLVDTTGELKGFYACASVVFVGKSLLHHGGQNPIEPAAYGRAIAVGPNMENFPKVMDDFRSMDAIVQVGTVQELETQLESLVANADLRGQVGERALGVVESRRGAVAATLKELRALLGQA